MKTAREQNSDLQGRLSANGISELECGNGNDFQSWSIERDEETNIPYMCYYPHNEKNRRSRIPDREKGAIKRVANVCERNGIHFYYQSDPRGCSLYVSKEPIADRDYTKGISCC